MNSYGLAESVHRQVNFSTTYKSDAAQYNVPEHWVVAGTYGDCEDYALAKRGKLIAAGWPVNKVALCTCLVEGDGHCVLFVETDKGGFILDNNYEWPVRAKETPYKWGAMLCNGKWYSISGWQ